MKCISLFIGAAILFGVASCSRPTSSGKLSVPRLVVALKPDKNPDVMLKEKVALTEFLTQALGNPVEVIIPLSGAVIEEGLANGTIDLAYVSGGTMLQVVKSKSGELLLAGEIKGKTTYSSYWVGKKESAYASVAELKGKPVAFSGMTSTSGKLIPHWTMIREGLLEAHQQPEVFFGQDNVWYGSGYVSAVERVLSGEAEAAAVSDYVLDGDKHLSVEQRGKLRKIAEQGPVPTHAIAIRSSLPEADKQALLAALTSLNEEKNHTLRDSVFTSKLVAVDTAAHLAPLVEAVRLTSTP